MSSNERFDAERSAAAAKRVAAQRVAQAEGMRRLAVLVNGKPLGSIRMEQLPTFCRHITGGPL